MTKAPRSATHSAGVGWLAAAMLAAACSASPSPSATWDVEALVASIDAEIAAASTEGYSLQQVELLEAAREEGVVTVASAREARDNYAGCLADAGVEFTVQPETGPADYPRLEGLVAVDSSADEAAELACYQREYIAVDALYQTQPAARQARDDLIASKRGPLIDCIRSAGYQVDDDATVDELRTAVITLLTGAPPGEAPDPDSAHESVNCAAPAGLAIENFGS